MLASSNDVYEEEFSAKDPYSYQDLFTEKMHYGALFNDAIQGQNNKETNPPADIMITLECSLQEFYCGSQKEINFQRGVLKDNGRSVESQFVNQEI